MIDELPLAFKLRATVSERESPEKTLTLKTSTKILEEHKRTGSVRHFNYSSQI